MNYDALESLRRSHPAWRLLMADHAPLVISFLFATFIRPNVRSIPEQELSSRLDDHLFHLRERLGSKAFPRAALQYLESWANDDFGWLRRYYGPDRDEPWFDLTPSAEKAIGWVVGLEQRQFVGTESRLRMVFELLQQMVEGTETSPELRIADLEKKRAAIDDEIQKIQAGHVDVMDDARIKDRFQQVAATARDLLADFREVDANFRMLDRDVREKITTWEGGKGELLEGIFGARDEIVDSDQGRSFRAFWDLLMSPSRQEQLTRQLAYVFELPAVQALAPDRRLLRIHYDWLEAGEVTQRTVARLSAQLRRYLDDRAWLENRRIMGILREIEQHAVVLRAVPPDGTFMELDAPAPEISLPMERPLFTPPHKTRIDDHVVTLGDDDLATDKLFEQFHVDKTRLLANVRRSLQTRTQVSLAEVLEENPLEQGLAELVTYLALASDDHYALISDAGAAQTVSWTDPVRGPRRARVPRIIFTRGGRVFDV
ncbi:MAG: DUF3375 domain-containing protein [Deltaproteobacteria bacterium]|nr:DUF3375 domain-containing protein [Deltaproteobacteria bacterium]